MAIGFERQQKSLIGANLPTARLDIQAPDYSGIQRIGNAIMNAGVRIGDERARRKEQGSQISDAMRGAEEGSAFGSTWVGKNEAGEPVEFTVPEGSDTFQRSFLQAAEASFDARFRRNLEDGLNNIQQRFVAGEITSAEASALMDAHKAGQLEGTPAYRRGYYAEVAETEYLQRSGLMGSQEASQKAQLVAEDLTSVIKDQLNKASAHASAGGDATPFLSEIDKAYDSLLGMRRIGPEEAKNGKAAVRQLVTGQALVNRLTTALAKGEIDPATIDRFGTAIETNDTTAEAVVMKGYQVGPFAKSSTPQGYRSKDVFGKIEDESLRKEIGQKLRQAATDWKQQAAASANADAFAGQLRYLASDNGRMASLSSEYHDDADDMMASAIAARSPFTDPDMELAVLTHLGQTKYVPKPLVTALQSMASSMNPEEVQQAVQLYRKIATWTDDRGVAVGDMLVNSMPADTKNLLSSIDEGYRLGMSAAEVVENMKTARGKEEFTLGRLIATYNSHVEDDDGFYKRLRTQWSDDYDVLPDPEVKDAFGTAFRHSMIVLRDPETAFAKAYEMVKAKYRKSDIMLNGIESGTGTLTNPDGYEIQQSGGLFGPAEGSEFEWLNQTVREDVLEALSASRLFVTSAELTGELFEGPSWIGKTAKLVPVQGSNPDMPEYSLRMFDKQGNDLGPLLQADARGNIKPFTINPHLERQQAGIKFSAQSMLKANEAAANESLMRLEDRLLNQLTPEQQGAMKPDVPLADFLPSVAPQLSEEYRLERSQIEEGLMNARKLYEEQTGEVPPPSKIGPQTLVTPGAAGFDVAAAAASLVDQVLPDGTDGTFLLRIAAQESNFGKAKGTFRLRGDKGITQVNTGSGFKEVKRQVAMGKGRVWAAAQKIKRELGIDMTQITAADLDKPIVAMAVARLYVEAVGRPVPQSVEGQAAWWKRHYNTYLGAGTASEFVRSARKVPDNWRSRYKAEG